MDEPTSRCRSSGLSGDGEGEICAAVRGPSGPLAGASRRRRGSKPWSRVAWDPLGHQLVEAGPPRRGRKHGAVAPPVAAPHHEAACELDLVEGSIFVLPIQRPIIQLSTAPAPGFACLCNPDGSCWCYKKEVFTEMCDSTCLNDLLEQGCSNRDHN